MRILTVLLICFGWSVSGSAVLAQSSSTATTSGGASASMARVPPSFEYLGTLRAEIGSRTVIENAPQGTRTIVYLTGGTFEGPRVKATIQVPAGDWITNRPDGSYKLDVRLTLKTDDGALILLTYNGIGQTTPTGATLRAAPLFETGDSRYTWLTRLQAVAVGERANGAVVYDLYALK